MTMGQRYNQYDYDYLHMRDEEAEYTSADWLSSLWEESTDLIDTGKPLDQSPCFMNQQDYTLNSPLIVDGLVSFLDFLETGKQNPLHYTKSWEKRKTMLFKSKYYHQAVKNPELYHSTCASLWLRTYMNTEGISDLIRKTDKYATETFPIISTYLKQWLGMSISFASRCLNSADTLKYGQWMLEFLVISWVLNAVTAYELEHLQANLKLRWVDDSNHLGGVIYQSKNLGEILIGHGIVYLPILGSIWDRNMVLMFKDTSTARFQSLINIQHKFNNSYSIRHREKMEELYRQGDLVLQHDPGTAYDCFGLVEPLSSLKLAELARTYRPLVPEFPHFIRHVRTKTEELSIMNPHAVRFLEIITEISDKQLLLTIYGSFRHWGHPFIRYLEGLEQLYKNVTATTEIDAEYAELLASDLAYKVLRKKFQSDRMWYIDLQAMPTSHPLTKHIQNKTMPPISFLLSQPKTWHRLPLKKCWDVPEVVEPSLIYSDKTHSITLNELIKHLTTNPGRPIPTLKVLKTLISTPNTNWKEFLKQVNDHGLERNDLIIGLKAKEREIKAKGRFFALMSWKLREYFVITEYLIKQNVLPLFKGLTMADDQTTLIKKMLQNTSGQGSTKYDRITIANHFDYQKWNNFQRQESTKPVFDVIGQFHGLPGLFSWTHKFFQNSLIYYRDRPDLMKVVDGAVVNKDLQYRVCWQGQAGGLEGLRQKGWSVLNLLVIERESKIRNTEIKILAQGDNQVVCTMYQLNPYKNQEDLVARLVEITQNNEVIINNIRMSVQRIGLTINEDETLQSADLLLYGKTIVFRGNIHCLEEKRYSRITCTTNDQLPSLGSLLSTVSTNCLTVAHYSKSPLSAMINYNWMGNFMIAILWMHNPALRTSPSALMRNPNAVESYLFRIGLLYLDPSLGGFSGMSLTRFHMRMFPDPVTESLTFWKKIAMYTEDSKIRALAVGLGNPKILSYNPLHFSKLLEDPASLNLPRGLSATNLIKDEIKLALIHNPDQIKNKVIKDAVLYVRNEEANFNIFLSSVKPCFPRFLSEFHSASFFGLTTSIVGLFQNSKTIRNFFKQKFQGRVDDAIIRCELGSLEAMARNTNVKYQEQPLWVCSASHADLLRSKSWCRAIVGTTVPHPLELLGQIREGGPDCLDCARPIPLSLHIIAIVPQGMTDCENNRGPYHPYLGSTTSENTSLIQPWEKDTQISFLRKASNIRKALNWFIDPTSNLGRTVKNNLDSMIGESSGNTIEGFKRTGSALHRYSCSRVSPGGYSANNSMYGSRMILSTDNMQLLGDANYDFMYQSLLLFAQQTVGEAHQEGEQACTYHLHISCAKCLREIEEPLLDCPYEYRFLDVSSKLAAWKPTDTPWMKDSLSVQIKEGPWEKLDYSTQSHEIGKVQGLIFGVLDSSYSDSNVLENLFPIGLKDKVQASSYMNGLVNGLYQAAILESLKCRTFYIYQDIDKIIRATYLKLSHSLAMSPKFLLFVQTENLQDVIRTISRRVPPSYPLNNHDIGLDVQSYLWSISYEHWRAILVSTRPQTWVFADFLSVPLSGILIIAHNLIKSLEKDPVNVFQRVAKQLNDVLIAVRTKEPQGDIQRIINQDTSIFLCRQEVRHAVKFSQARLKSSVEERPMLVFGPGIQLDWRCTRVEYTLNCEMPPDLVIPRLQNPLVSAIRIPQIATGTFLKIEIILNKVKPNIRDGICGGDGSGGITALVLRRFPRSRMIFNSLIDMEEVELAGALPSPPSAIVAMNVDVSSRCVNLHNVWDLPQDLTEPATWRGFQKLKRDHGMMINFCIFDMQVKTDVLSDCIDDLMYQFIPSLVERDSVVIIKSYLHRLITPKSLLVKIAQCFHFVYLTQTDVSSSHTSEIYVVLDRLKENTILNMYPRWDRVGPWLGQAYCMRSYEQEFDRAISLLDTDMTIGIPRALIPNPYSELSGIWEFISLDRLGTVKWNSIFQTSNQPWVLRVFGAAVLMMESVINTTQWVDEENMHLPSDNRLPKALAYYVGTLLYIALLTGDVGLGSDAQRMLDNPFFIFFDVREGVSTRIYRRGKKRMSWFLTKRQPWVWTKRVYLQHKIGLVASTTRQLLAISRGPITYRPFMQHQLTNLVNRHLTVDHIREYTGMYDLV